MLVYKTSVSNLFNFPKPSETLLMELFLNCKFIKLSIRLIYSGITSILLKEAFKFFKFGKFNKINDISNMLFLTIFNDYIELIGSLNIYILEIELNEISKTRRYFNF